MMDQNEIDAALFSLTLECSRPSLRFRAMFSAKERMLIQHSINTMVGVRNHNSMMQELGRRGYGPNRVTSDSAEHQCAGLSTDDVK